MNTCDFCNKTWTPQSWMDLGYRCSKCGRSFCNDCAIANMSSIGGTGLSISKSCPICDRGLEPKPRIGSESNVEKAGCFIATATFGTPIAKEVKILKLYRDEVLLKTRIGTNFTNLYYRISPPIAILIKNHKIFQRIV